MTRQQRPPISSLCLEICIVPIKVNLDTVRGVGWIILYNFLTEPSVNDRLLVSRLSLAILDHPNHGVTSATLVDLGLARVDAFRR